MRTALIMSVALVLITANNLFSHQYKWRLVPNSPVANSRFNDVYFINPGTGWVCRTGSHIFKTTNEGKSWFQTGSTPTSNRCISFFDSLNGWTGSYVANNFLSNTTDGGINWTLVELPEPMNTGICGLFRVDDSVMYGCGRYWGPARMIKTTEKGNTWDNIEMDHYAKGLIDLHFFSRDTGIVVGRILYPERGIILKTVDGGISWDTLYVTKSINVWCWKVSFTNERLGHISLESFLYPNHYLKTTDRGNTWTEKFFVSGYFDEEGIGFINENTGWIGGWEPETFETTNAGNNWHRLDTSGNAGLMYNVNRFRFFGDTLGYAVGKYIYKYSRDVTTDLETNAEKIVSSHKLYQNYPNPFNPVTKIKFDIAKNAIVNLSIYNILGQEIDKIIEDKILGAGSHEFDWDATDFPSGLYFYKLFNEEFEITKKMTVVK